MSRSDLSRPDPAQPDRRPPNRRGLGTEIRAATDLSTANRDEMYALFAHAYDGTDRARFDADLAAKRDVLLLRTGRGRIAGFTTLAVIDATDRGRPIRCVFSGDTLVDPALWGTNALNFAWIRHLAAIRAEAPATPLYWLLISKGFRTYRYLSTFARHYVPRPDAPDDPALVALRDRLATRLFGSAFDPGRGVVAHDPPRERLAPALAGLPETGRAAVEARYFAQANPGYAQGQELVCLCPLDPDNMRPFARRLYARALA
ncbi:MAG: hypothetical protein KDK53_11145 [Maritimibacter sp.]|nr:hypothetical protein [Maritimibacter sp.]